MFGPSGDPVGSDVGGMRASAPADAWLDRADFWAWRATVNEQLRGIRDDVAELRGRVNSLVFIVVGAAVGQIVIRLITGH